MELLKHEAFYLGFWMREIDQEAELLPRGLEIVSYAP